MLPPSLPSGQQRAFSTVTFGAVRHVSASSALVLCSCKLDSIAHSRCHHRSPSSVHRHQQRRHFWFDRRRLWSTYLGNDVQKHLDRRHRVLRHKYAKAMLRRSLWDRETQLQGQNAPTSFWGWRAASSWGKHCGRWVNYRPTPEDQNKSGETGAEKPSYPESRQERIRRRIEEVKKLVDEDPFGAIFGRHADATGLPKSTTHFHWSPFHWLHRDSASTHRNSQDIIDAVSRRTDEAASTKVANSPKTTDTAEEEYDFDPISMRKIPRQPNKDVATTATSSISESYDIPVKKFRGNQDQQIPQSQASAGETSSDFRSSHHTTQAARDSAQLLNKNTFSESRAPQSSNSSPNSLPASKESIEADGEKRDHVDPLRASDVRTATGQTKLPNSSSFEKKRSVRQALDAEFSKEPNAHEKAAEQAAMKNAAKRGRRATDRGAGGAPNSKAASSTASTKKLGSRSTGSPAIDPWGYSLAPKGLETSYADELEKRVQIGELEFARELEARDQNEPDAYSTEPMGLQTSFEEEQREGWVDPRQVEEAAREKEADAYTKKPMGLETSYENEVREYPEGWQVDAAPTNEANTYSENPMGLEKSFEDELRGTNSASDQTGRSLDFDGYIGKPTEVGGSFAESLRNSYPSPKRKVMKRRDDGYSREPMGLETSYMEEVAGTANHEPAEQKLREEQQKVLERELDGYEEGLETSYERETRADAASGDASRSPSISSAAVRSEGDLADNVADFAARDRWYKQEAPHSGVGSFEKYASSEIPDSDLDANLKAFFRGDSQAYEAARCQENEEAGSRNVELESALEEFDSSLGPRAYRFTTGQDSLEEELAIRAKVEQISSLSNRRRPSASSTNEYLHELMKSPSRDPDPVALRLEEAEQRLHEEVQETNDLLYDLRNEIVKSESTLASHSPYTSSSSSTLFDTGTAGLLPSRFNNLQREVGIHDLHLRLAEMQIERAGTILYGRPVATTSSTSYTSAPQPHYLPEESHQSQPQSAQSLPTLYKVLAYDRATKNVILATTTSSTASSQAEPSLTPSEALAKLTSPARFLAHFPALQAEGYEIVSGSGDVLVFKKVRDATDFETANLESTTSSRFAGFNLMDQELVAASAVSASGTPKRPDIQYEAAPHQINPVDGTTTTPQTGNFASPTGFVNHDAFNPLELDAREYREYEEEMRDEAMRKFAENARARAEAVNLAEVEPREDAQRDKGASAEIQVQSNRTQEESFGRKLGRGALITTVAAGVTYAAGVVTEIWRTGGF